MSHFPCRKCGATEENGYGEHCALCIMAKDAEENAVVYRKLGDI